MIARSVRAEGRDENAADGAADATHYPIPALPHSTSLTLTSRLPHQCVKNRGGEGGSNQCLRERSSFFPVPALQNLKNIEKLEAFGSGGGGITNFGTSNKDAISACEKGQEWQPLSAFLHEVREGTAAEANAVLAASPPPKEGREEAESHEAHLDLKAADPTMVPDRPTDPPPSLHHPMSR